MLKKLNFWAWVKQQMKERSHDLYLTTPKQEHFKTTKKLIPTLVITASEQVMVFSTRLNGL